MDNQNQRWNVSIKSQVLNDSFEEEAPKQHAKSYAPSGYSWSVIHVKEEMVFGTIVEEVDALKMT